MTVAATIRTLCGEQPVPSESPFGQHPDTCPNPHASGITDGPVFRGITRHGQLQASRLSTDAVGDIVKRACAAAGLDPTRYAGHSLRSGLATSSAEGEAPERSIMRQGGWRSERTMRKYIRPATIWKERGRLLRAITATPHTGRHKNPILFRVIMTYLEAAAQVLQRTRKPMTTREITESALREGLIQSHGKTPQATMSATLYLYVRDAGTALITREYEPGRRPVRWRYVG